MAAIDSAGNSALLAAVKSRQVGSVIALRKMGADVEFENADGEFGLLYAAKEADVVMTHVLLDLGAPHSQAS